MDPKFSSIGEKIRNLRLSRGMTQKELATGSVTRNMLSLIENGNALPSLPTLVELAQKLDVSVGYFFAVSEKEAAAFIKMSRIDEIMRLYREGEWATCLDACRNLPHPDEEILLLTAECALSLAIDACDRYALNTANAHLAEAERLAPQDFSPAVSLRSTVAFIQKLIQCVTHPVLPEELLDASLYASSRIPAEFFVYMRALSFLDGDRSAEADGLLRSGLIQAPAYRFIIEARKMMQQGNHSDAFSLLHRVLHDEKPGFFTMFRLLDSLESCASTLGDFKNAYQYSTQKIKLLEQFSQ